MLGWVLYNFHSKFHQNVCSVNTRETFDTVENVDENSV